MRLIDADALDYALGASDEDIYFHHILEDAPTIDAVSVMHARWLYEYGDPAMLPCSACGYKVYRYNNTPYCPNCGAKMDGKRRDSE